ncbi:hypothetical protein [Fusobacterium sp. PH5-44]|uniref:hypothetical protein n=1 Tax=unclassified Fusobacterium TaxID=2648384 RepID=UPI003D1D1C5E
MKKKLSILLSILTLVSFSILGKEVYTESYISKKLSGSFSKAPDFVGNGSQVKGIRVTNDVVSTLGISDSPFYMKGADGKEYVVRLGDYLTSVGNSGKLSIVSRQNFENNFKSKDGSVIFNKNEVLKLAPVDFTKVDEDVDKGD